MTAKVRGGLGLLLPILLLPLLASCDKKEEQQKEPTLLQISGNGTCSAVEKTLTFTVQCDFKWTATLEDADWAKIDKQTATADGGSVAVRFTANHEAGNRSGVLVVTSGSKSIRKTFTQNGLDQFFSPKEIHLAGMAKATLTFDSPSAWTASVAEGADWIDLQTTRGDAGAAQVSIAAKDPNENVGDRSGSLTITIDGENYPVPVVQSQKDIILADNTQVAFDYKGGDFLVLTQSNVSYSITCSADWVQHVQTKALNEAQEYFSVAANQGTSERTATIRFAPTKGDAPAVTVSVVQSGMDPVLTVTTPGLYGIDGKNYVYGSDGWNLSSCVTAADGSFEYRLISRKSLSVIAVTGVDTAAEEGSACQLKIRGVQKDNKILIKDYNATVLGADEELIWLKQSASTYFVIQK